MPTPPRPPSVPPTGLPEAPAITLTHAAPLRAEHAAARGAVSKALLLHELGALAARAGLTQDPEWRALLLIDQAGIEVERGEMDRALAALDAACAIEGPARFGAFLHLESLAIRMGRDDVLARALDAEIELLEQ